MKKWKERQGLLIGLMAAVMVVCIGVTVWALFLREPDIILNPDYAPVETEENQTPIPGDNGSSSDVEAGVNSVSLTYSTEVTIDLSDTRASLIFGNPGSSTMDIVLQIIIQDQVIVQSGRLTAGNQITKLELLDGAEKLLTEGGYEGEFLILYYNPTTGEKSVVNTEIPITVTVKK